MKRILVFLTAIMLLLAIGSPGIASNYMTTGDQTFYGNKTWEHNQTIKGTLTAEGPVIGFTAQYGDEYYVCSTNGADSAGNYGTTYKKPFATVNYAYDQCTADQGDIIYILPGHAETIDAATDIVMDLAGITVI